ncbi:MAG: hypothetical protein K5787_17385 [Lentisphaeria bacterium]|nr:hypothetical protein [Lentisphaeria bacterium]
MSAYNPHPVDTSNVELSEELLALVETMAENVHEIWAQKRIVDGWKYGPRRDDEKKLHPCLVPYSELPEPEKEYDRHTSIDTLKLIQKLGYEIQLASIKDRYSHGKLSLRILQELVKKHPSMTDDDRYWLAKQLLAIGENFLAYDQAEKIECQEYKYHVQGMALARSGSFGKAVSLADELAKFHNSECDGFRARIFKDRAIAATTPEDKRNYYRKSAEINYQAFIEQGEYYNGVNAASCFLLAGDTQKAWEIAEETLKARGINHNDLWATATRGECLLVLGERQKAKEEYRKAYNICLHGKRFGDFSSTLRQLRLLLNCLDGNLDELPGFFPQLPKVGVFFDSLCGDGEEISKDVQDEISNDSCVLAYLTLAGKGSILVAEKLLEQNIDCQICLQQPQDELERKYVDEPVWLERLQAVLKHSCVSIVPPECDSLLGNDVMQREFNERYLLGLATLKAENLSFGLCGLYNAVGKENKEEILYGMPGAKRALHAILFSDVKNFSQLDEKACLAFNRHFIQEIPEILKEYDKDIEYKNTWGDALYIVFKNVSCAGKVALAIQKWVRGSEDWEDMPKNGCLSMRIGLHVGTMTSMYDYIQERLNFFGRAATKAARIEPITEEGQIFASGAFAAFAATENERAFVCDYVGVRELPKRYGSTGVYMLHKA